MNLTSNTPSNFIKAQVSSAAGMHAQSMRIRVISENVAHADSTSPGPGQPPYGRKVIFFVNEHDKKTGVDVVKVQKISQDKSPFHKVHRPHDPAADAQGYIEKTNVNSLIEMADLREAMQSHAANLEVYKASTSMRNETIQALKV